MLLHILLATPARVWFLLAGLVALGVSQARPRRIGVRRAALLPIAMLGLSLAGVGSAFGFGPAAVVAWLAGIAAALGAAQAWLPRPEARWSESLASVHIAGSWLPMTAILALFATKYVAGVSLAMHPSYAADTSFALPFSFAFGLFSGVFAARGLQLWNARRIAR